MPTEVAHSEFFRKPEIRYKALGARAPNRYKRGMRLRLKELREARGLKQYELADMAGLSRSYYTEIEKGKKPLNSLRMQALAKALKVSVPELILNDEDDEEAEMISDIRTLTPEERKLVRNLIQTFAAHKKN